MDESYKVIIIKQLCHCSSVPPFNRASCFKKHLHFSGLYLSNRIKSYLNDIAVYSYIPMYNNFDLGLTDFLIACLTPWKMKIFIE